MKVFYLIFVYELSSSLCAWTDNYVDPDFSSYGRERSTYFQNDRYNARFYKKKEAELEHAINDGRCPVVDETLVQKPTKYGTVTGRKIYLCDGPGVNLRERPGQPDVKAYKPVNVFLGIPYAQPPTRQNKLQFQPPQLPQPWNEIEAIAYKPACPQNNKYLGHHRGVNNTDEDCLYLNIFSPDSSQERKPLNKYSVMIYIHGGNWDHGAANIFPGHMLAASQEVIVVTFNYRLGHLGFLATADSASPGNY
uniref:U99-Liphistoxin-Lsp1a_1 n=1 Tax=Liphistius sp. SGP-2016 TaxID=1905180 RepID=A0A4Q8K0S9_9ARAC